MASKQQAIKLYWVFTDDHDEDWFIFAHTAREAKRFHEDYEGYGEGDAHARLIVRDVRLTRFQNGKPPCHAQMRELMALGFEDAGSVPNQRSVRFEGRIYTEGILESLVEQGRKNLALMLRNGRLELEGAPPETPAAEQRVN